jgi:hypothetical protein
MLVRGCFSHSLEGSGTCYVGGAAGFNKIRISESLEPQKAL